MDRLLKPEKFDTLPEDSESTKIFNYRLRTFGGFVATVASNAGKNEEINKLAMLTNFLTHKPYLLLRKLPPTTKPRPLLLGLTTSKRMLFSPDIS